MSNCRKFQENEEGKVLVSVDVTRIVKYCCVASVLIIWIIFGTSVYKKILEKQVKDC